MTTMAGFPEISKGDFVTATYAAYAMSATDWEKHLKGELHIEKMELIPITACTTIGPIIATHACPFGHHAVVIETPDWNFDGAM